MAVATLSTLTPILPAPLNFPASPVDRHLRIYGSDNNSGLDNNCLGHTYVLQAGARRSGHPEDEKPLSVLWEAVNMQGKEKTEKVCKQGIRKRKAKPTARPARRGRNTWKLRREKLVLKKRQAMFNSRPGAPFNSTAFLITQYSRDTGYDPLERAVVETDATPLSPAYSSASSHT